VRLWRGLRPSVYKFVGPAIALILLFSVACGAAAPDAPSAEEPAPATDTTATTTDSAAPTAAPEAASDAPGEPVVNPGKLTWMIGGWGTERFDSTLAGTGGGNNYARILHGFPIASDPNGAMIPGIATEWSVSSDGLVWTVTIREGVNFHDGSDLTAEDVAWTWQHEWGPEALEHSVSTTSQTQARNTEKIEQIGPNQVSATLIQAASGFPSGLLAEAGPNWVGHILPARDAIHDEAAE
jgi:peptide/nickel transport system substrate-binding protein